MSGSIELVVNEVIENVKRQMISCGYRATNELRNAELETLRGEGSGRVYKVPGTHGKRSTKATQKLKNDYGHKLRGGQLYRASAPGEVPANRTGAYRQSWQQETNVSGGGMKITSTIKSNLTVGKGYVLGSLLEDGTSRMSSRPHTEKIAEKALPRIIEIYEAINP